MVSGQRTHIAVSHTPFHLLQLGILAQRLAENAEHLAIFHEGEIPMQIPGLQLATVHKLPGYTGWRSGRRLAMRNAAVVTSHLAWRLDSTLLYLSDLKWPTNNLVYFARPRLERARRTRLFTDGLGSYLPRDDVLRTSVTSAVKMGAGVIGAGPRHHPLRGNHFGLSRRYARAVYGFYADQIMGDLDKVTLVPQCDVVTPEISASEAGSSLILGSPLDEQRFDRSQAIEIVEEVVRAAKMHTPPKTAILYKPHHFEGPLIAQHYARLGIEPITDPRPAELVVRALRVRRLFGTYSSALAFAPAFATSECVSFSAAFVPFAKGYLNVSDREALRVVLTGFGVRFVRAE